MSIQQMFIGGKAPIPLTPYTLNSLTTVTNATSIGSGSTGNGGINNPTGSSSGQVGFTAAGYTSTTSGTSAGFYNVLAPSNTALGGSLLTSKLSTGSSPWPGVSTGWGTYGSWNRYQYSGQVAYGVNSLIIAGVNATTTKTGEGFFGVVDTSLPITITPTNYAGGTLFFVTISVTSGYDITITGGEGTGSASSLDAPSTNGTVMTDAWKLVWGVQNTTNLRTLTFAYYRSGSVREEIAEPISITASLAGSPVGIINMGIGVSSFSTAAYDTGPIGPPASPTPTPTITPSAVTPTPTPTISLTPSVTSSVTPTPSVTPTISTTPTMTPPPASATPTPSVTPSAAGEGVTNWFNPTSVTSTKRFTNANNMLACDGTNAVGSGTDEQSVSADVNFNLSSELSTATTITGVEIRITGYRTGPSGVTNDIWFEPFSGTQRYNIGSLWSTTPGTTFYIGGQGFLFNSSVALPVSQFSNCRIVLDFEAAVDVTTTWTIDCIQMRVYYT